MLLIHRLFVKIMKIAYLISAYKDPQQLSRMVQALHTEDTRFFVHVDANVDIKPFISVIIPPHLSVFKIYTHTI